MRRILFVAIIAILLTGCATGPSKVTRYNLTLKQDMSSSLKKDGLKLNIEPITGFNYTEYPAMNTPISYGYNKGDYSYDSDSPWCLGPPPSFKVTMTNNTDHILRFNRAVVKLEDDVGNLYDILTKSELRDRTKNVLQYYAQNEEIYFNSDVIFSKIHDLNLIDNNFELLPGYTQTGYIIFNLPHSYKSNERFIAGKQYIKLLMFEIPTEVDDAGKVKKTTRFEFVWDINSKTVTIN